ncbi:MAG: hypothetical protein S0880_09605 [Actinomycetota bacterium]|nr:hypothetical protein [Actinomycetota bacterium]
MISMFVNCAKAWTRLVVAYHRVTRRPQITWNRPAPAVRGARR